MQPTGNLSEFQHTQLMFAGALAHHWSIQSACPPMFVDQVCGDEVANGKPNPDVFLKAADLLGAHPSECLVGHQWWAAMCHIVFHCEDSVRHCEDSALLCSKHMPPHASSCSSL